MRISLFFLGSMQEAMKTVTKEWAALSDGEKMVSLFFSRQW